MSDDPANDPRPVAAQPGVWEPARPDAVPLPARLRDMLAALAERDGEFRFDPPPVLVRQVAPLLHADAAAWLEACAGFSDDERIRLVRALALGEMAWPEWEVGARSPVIALAADLRRRGAWPADLTRWLRQVSTNRFLPYGNLQARL